MCIPYADKSIMDHDKHMNDKMMCIEDDLATDFTNFTDIHG